MEAICRYERTGTEEPWILGRARREALRGLERHLPPGHVEGARRCAERLLARLPRQGALRRNQVLVAYGGGKDSSYTVAFVRCMQLLLHQTFGETFRLRVATNRHAGMPRAVMENIDRVYTALGLSRDPDCELLLVDGDEIKPFRADQPLPRALVQQNREDILMAGHRTSANPRPTFCNACNFSMVNSFGLAASHGEGVDVIITGDARREQRAYYVWVKRLAQKFGVDSSDGRADFAGFLAMMRDLSRLYFVDIHGSHAPDAVRRRLVTPDVPRQLQFFSIYGDTGYASGEHWSLLTEHLGFRFDEVAFSFTESDCGNPALMAHLRGLKCERDYGRSYAEGIREYVAFAVELMRSKQFPEPLVDTMLARYDGDEQIARRRAAAGDLARELYDLDETQLVCMVYSPFAARGERLARFLAREHPGLAPRCDEIHALLRGDAPDAPGSRQRWLAEALRQRSGLTVDQLRVAYASPLHGPSPGGDAHLITDILARDPHKRVIETRHAPDGEAVRELISGR
jgi:hypothetical protein